MEAIFSATLAVYTSWIMIVCIIIFFTIYLFDGIGFFQRVYRVLIPASHPAGSDTSESDEKIISPILEPIEQEEVDAHEASKVRLEEEHEQEILESEVFEEKILEEIKEAESIELTESIEDMLDEKVNEIVNTQDAVETIEDIHTVPITASIPEPNIEAQKTGEPHHTEKLYTIVSEVKTLLARGQSMDARALIIQGLAINKNHRELNLILGSIYESERQAQKAEYIYKDLALVYEEDGEILERLANILIVQKRYDLALEIYKKITSLTGETEGSLYIMTHLAQELNNNQELYVYAHKYQRKWPNNPDILTLLAQAEMTLGHRQDAIQTLIKLKNLTPYNNEIMETIAKLTMEEELAGNFTSRDNN